MTSAIGWYGPLIDLSDAPANVGCFVQLVVAVHRFTPVQYKSPNGGDVIRMDFRVGDDTRPQFFVSIWQKHLMSSAAPGDVILLQNVKIVKFGHGVEARTVHCSSIVRLVHPHELLSGEVDELLQKCKVGIAAKDKLKKVIGWVKTNGSVHLKRQQLSRNWKPEEECRDCNSLAELLHQSNLYKATFHASIGEIFLPLHSTTAHEVEKEMMFISCRLDSIHGTSLAEDFICTGCQLCGSPLGLHSRDPTGKHGSDLLYCDKSPNRLHAIGLIFRPFLLYVWDDMDCLPLLVRNKAAEILFGNIRADRLHDCIKGKLPQYKSGFMSLPEHHSNGHRSPTGESTHNKRKSSKGIDLHYVWMVMMKAMLQPQKNSPLKFETTINNATNKDEERLEMVNVTMPCFKSINNMYVSICDCCN
ncbi:hypothetical protein MLD38_033992 [Melastoma candidum]|uniref:Uncharacterized protein n=1 Tax=Melastoma candidum TaxID=119954 RepID=A0ACB9MCC5_9MYRT|nr:hypothetical protein MLD38_033992 [Melastoma candidum]